MISRIKEAVEKHTQLILDAYDYIWEHPETGYREIKTSQYLETSFNKLGYELIKAENIPGFYTILDTGRLGPEVLLLGEMDALICPAHPHADVRTGAVHCCGHGAQCSTLLGIAAALKEPHILDELCGRIRLCVVPAEELIEIEFRSELKKEGIIHYLGGKTEFLYRGYFDGVDLAFMVHVGVDNNALVRNGSVGLVAKRVIYKGVSAHAGGYPWEGCNALYAANQGLAAVNAIRETFKEEDLVRVHPIITQGGSSVNAIPDEVIIESFVRGKELGVIYETNKRVNRAFCGGALSLGANINIIDTPGYAPLLNDEGMIKVAIEAWPMDSEIAFEWKPVIGTGSTDFGDLSCLMPVVHPYVPKATGKSHGADYMIENPEFTCVTSAVWQLNMLYILLKEGATRAKTIMKNYKPLFSSKEQYFEFIEKFNSEGERIVYDEHDNANVKKVILHEEYIM